jgi:hypothetical protein
MTESYAHIKEGAITSGAIIESFVATAAIEMWSPVVLASAGTNEEFPRCTGSSAAGQEAVIGVAVGPKRASGKAADAAGDKVQVVVLGPCKLKVLGNSVNIALGDLLRTSATAAKADKLVPFDVPATVNEANLQAEWDAKANKAFAKALKASTADDDIIPAFVNGAGGMIA